MVYVTEPLSAGDQNPTIIQHHQPSSFNSSSSSLSSSSRLLRCFCNHPSCVATGSICKSTSAACFAQRRLGPSADSTILYACAELLPVETDRRVCLATAVDNIGERGTSVGGREDRGLRAIVRRSSSMTEETLCCATDMCNYYFFRSDDGGYGDGGLNRPRADYSDEGNAPVLFPNPPFIYHYL